MSQGKINTIAGQSNGSFDQMTSYLRRGDISLALGLVCILVVLIMPLPTWLLDLSLALSITLSVLILMTVLFITKPLEFSSFPTVLLITTLLRLSLNLASTRLILANGHNGGEAAGKVIEAFGSYMTGNNYIIGIIVFGILTLVNFVVITKGSGRIAEVAARFSLDAMPGKQMAIDADLSSGLLNEDEARQKRKDLESESTFFGSMDGAAKFVRGDAIAGLMITFINIVGGIIIGTTQKGITLLDAAHSYTLLTIGDGLVTQIPALIVSIAAGMLVSKSGTVGSTDKALFGQLSYYPSAMGLSAILMGAVSLLPGMPMFPFLVLSCIAAIAAFQLQKKQEDIKSKAQESKQIEHMKKEETDEQSVSKALAIDQIRLELGYGLLSLINNEEGKKLTNQIKGIRRQVASDVGFIIPSVRIQDNLHLNSNEYAIYIKEILAGKGEVRASALLAMDPSGAKVDLPGEQTKEPTFNLVAAWIDPKLKEEAQFKGYTVVDPQTVIATHLTEMIKDNMPELLNYAATQNLVDELGKEYEKLIADLIPSQVTIGNLQRVLQNLLAERVSIRDLPSILEGVAEAVAFTRSIGLMTEHVRAKLARQISDSYTNADGFIPLITMSPEWEEVFSESLIGDGDEKQLALPPSKLQEFIKIVKDKFNKQLGLGNQAVLLTTPTVRPYVRSLIERFRSSTIVMSQNEIHAKVKIKTVDQI